MRRWTLNAVGAAQKLGRKLEVAEQRMDEDEVRRLVGHIRNMYREYGKDRVQRSVEHGQAAAAQDALREQVRRFGHNYMG